MNNKRTVLGCVVFVLIISFACWQFANIAFSCGKEKAILVREPTYLDGFELQWVSDDVYLPSDDNGIFLIAADDKLVGYGTLTSCGTDTLFRLDQDNGKREPGVVSGIPRNTGINTITHNPDYIFLGYGGSKAIESTLRGSGGVAAYDIEDGNIVWTRQISGTNHVRSLAANDEFVAVDGGTSSVFLLAPTSGEIIAKRVKVLEPGNPLGPSLTYSFWYESILSKQKLVTDEETTILFWADQFADVKQPPVILEEVIIIRTNDGTVPGRVKSVDRRTGVVTWQTDENVISNVAVTGSTVFFVTNSAELVALDIHNGEVIGSVQFGIERVQLGSERGFFVAADSQNIFAYFGDGRQLFAFNFSQQQ